MTALDYSNQNLDQLPFIPEGTLTLYCYNNQLTSLPLFSYYCASHNSTTTQKALLFVSIPSSLRDLYRINNSLYKKEELPKLPIISFTLRQLCRINIMDIKEVKENKLPRDLIEYLKETNVNICNRCNKDRCQGDLTKIYEWNTKWNVPTYKWICIKCL